MDAVPATHAQKFIYQVVNQIGPRSRWLQFTWCMRIVGPIDVADFQRAAVGLAIRFPVLRSLLEFSDGELLLREDGPEPSFEVVDVGGHTDDQVDVVLSRRADEPIDLFQGSSFRVVLARRHSGEGFLMLVGHHVFLDFLCMLTLGAEYLDLLRTDPAQIDPAHLTPAPWSSGDRGYLAFARREQEMIRDGTFSRRAQYWQDYLEQAEPALHLPGRQADPAVQSWDTVPFRLSPESFRAFSDRSCRLGVTRFALTAASLFEALEKTTSQSDLSISVVSTTRRPPFGRTIGRFAEMFVLTQRVPAGGLGDDAIRALGAGIIKNMTRYLPPAYLEDRLDWRRKRAARGYSMTDVNLDYLPFASNTSPARPGAEQPSPQTCTDGPVSGYHASPFPQTAREYTTASYYGVVLSWVVAQEENSLSGFLNYESGLVTPQLAQTMVSAFTDALSRSTAGISPQ